MLFVENKVLAHSIGTRDRIQLLKELHARDFAPMIRSARAKAFEVLSGDSFDYAEMETELAGLGQRKNEANYVRGDIFPQSDHLFFMVFSEDESELIRAGIVYKSETPEPFRKLDSFCREVRDLLTTFRINQPLDHESSPQLPEWQHGTASMPGGFKAFVARQDSDSMFNSLRHKKMSDRVRAAGILEDTSVRVFLRRAKEAHIEGYAAKLLTGDTIGRFESSIERLTEAGLVEREVQVSCRKTGHALFRLPNPHALAVVTVSDATCSECGAAVADEKVEEVIAPTRLAASLLEDGSWLISRLHQVLSELGIPESEIAVGPSEGDGYGQMMANVCGESFLILARDGDLTPAFARWAIDLDIETEASHLVVVATGRVHNHAGALLQNHARHRVRAGQDFELVLADDALTATDELRHAFERVAQRVLDEQLCDLDGAVGLSLSRMVVTKFKLQAAAELELQTRETEESGHLRKPLSLAAHAGAAHTDVFTPGEFSEDQPRDVYEHENNDHSPHEAFPENGFISHPDRT